MHVECLSEIETEFENTLTYLSWVKMGSNHEKIEVEKLVTHSLKHLISSINLQNVFFFFLLHSSTTSHALENNLKYR